MSTDIPTPGTTLSQLHPSNIVLAVAFITFHGFVRLAERYLPEFLGALGSGPVVAGLVATLGLAAAVGVRTIETEDLRSSSVVLLATALAAVGLLIWASASSLDSFLGIPLTPLSWVLVGVVLVPLWDARGPGTILGTDGDGFAPTGPLSGAVINLNLAGEDSQETEERTDAKPIGDGRSHVVAGMLGTASAAVFATAAFAGGDTIGTGFALLAAAGAAVGLVGAITLAVIEHTSVVDDPSADESAASRSTDEPVATDPVSLPALEDVRTAYTSLPEIVRYPVLGDGLVRLGTVLTSLFLVLIVVDFHGLFLSIGVVELSPVAVFGLFVLAEAIGAVGGAFVAPALEDVAVDHRWVLVGGLSVLSLLPLSIVAAPPNAAVLAVLFTLFGARTAIRPLRPTLGAQVKKPQRADSRVPVTIRTAIRVALVPVPLIGGVLYAISPVIAFGLATTIGLLGVRELLRTLG